MSRAPNQAGDEDMPRGTHDEEDGTTLNMTLELRGFSCAPSEISDILGLTPKRTGTAGEPCVDNHGRATARTVKASFWILKSDTDYLAPLHEQLTSLLAPIRNLAPRFQALPPMRRREIRCTLIRGGRVPSFVLRPELTATLAELGLTLRIDFLHIVDGPGEEEIAAAPTS